MKSDRRIGDGGKVRGFGAQRKMAHLRESALGEDAGKLELVG